MDRAQAIRRVLEQMPEGAEDRLYAIAMQPDVWWVANRLGVWRVTPSGAERI